MHLDPFIVLGSAVVGLLVGLTGAGGGALMTPMLILLFGVKPSSAISSDLVAAVVMRPVGAAVHLYKKTVNLRLVGWMVCGSVPMAFVGSFLLHELGATSPHRTPWRTFPGAAPPVGAGRWCSATSWTAGPGRAVSASSATSRSARCRPSPSA